MFFGVDFDAGGAEGEEALGVFTEVEDLFLGVECTVFGFVLLLDHRN